MTPGPSAVHECPHCQALSRTFTAGSTFCFPGRCWSDGFGVESMTPRPVPLARCSGCRGFFWLEDSQVVGHVDEGGHARIELGPSGELEFVAEEPAPVPAEWRDAPFVSEPTRAEYLEALGAGVADTLARELKLRTLAWHAANAPFRVSPRGRQKEPQLKTADRDNMRHLVELHLRQASLGGPLLCAELARELGEFNEALVHLRAGFPEDLRPLAELIRRLAESAECSVVMFDLQ